jgi:hypothetical protein
VTLIVPTMLGGLDFFVAIMEQVVPLIGVLIPIQVPVVQPVLPAGAPVRLLVEEVRGMMAAEQLKHVTPNPVALL